MAFNEEVGFTDVDIEAQTYPNEKLPRSIALPTSTSNIQKPHPILSTRGIWTLIRPSSHSSHNLLSSLAILFFWHYFGQLVIAFFTVLPTIFREGHEEWHASYNREPMSFLDALGLIWQVTCFLLAGVFMIMCLRRSISGSCGCTARAKEYGARWLWPSFYEEMADSGEDWSMFSKDILSKAFRETMWTLVRTHEVAWSVAFTMVWWNVFLTFHNWLIPTGGFFTGMLIDEARRYAFENSTFRGVLASWVTGYFAIIFTVWVAQGLPFTDRMISYQRSKPTMSSLRSALTKVAGNHERHVDVEMVMREIVKERAIELKRFGGFTAMDFETLIETEPEWKVHNFEGYEDGWCSLA